MSSKPNILYIQVDQMTANVISLYGHSGARTPNLERLAARGIRFDRAYSACPVCGPSRMSMLTGRYVSDIGCFDNASPLASDEPTFAHYLTNAGYETVVSGKMHITGPDQLHGFKKRLTTDVYPSDFWWTPSLSHSASEKRFQGTVAEVYRIGPDSWNSYLDYDSETHFRAREYLRSKRAGSARSDSPFCLVVSYHHPHEPFQPPAKYREMYADAEIELPKIPDNIEELRSPMDRWLNRYHGLGNVRPYSDDEYREMRRSYFGVVSYVDDLIGELLSDLDEFGLSDNTAILFVSDHGEMLGERGMIQKRSFYEFSARVPMVVALPTGYSNEWRGTVCSTPVSLIDTVPTMMKWAGAETELPLDGEDLMTIVSAGEIERTVFSEFHSEGVHAPCFMLRNNRWKYCYFHDHGEQLFDLENDPGEWNNLANDEASSEMRDGFRAEILSRFDPDDIVRRSDDSKRRRYIIQPALERNETHWDYQPVFDATRQYRRRHLSGNDV